MMKVGIYGNGNAAWTLGQALKSKSEIQLSVSARDPEKGSALANELGVDFIPESEVETSGLDVLILAISDGAIAPTAASFDLVDTLLVHTSGPTPMDVLYNGSEKVGVFYPLQTMSKGKDTDFSQVPFLLESDTEDGLTLLKKLATLLSSDIREMSSVKRLALHASAVFVNNFTNHINAIATDICAKYNVPFDLLHPLIDKTAEVAKSGQASESQTGPAVRKDRITMMAHQSILSPSENEIYRLLSEHIQNRHETEL
ncbi:Rossmann-like and DUF2520 domain-containing protein [Phaeocystidibacter marisrubri]|uniref:DUF2520 domain-containing protein n=1 Tax=Phaeocystidibacter marisrubri TaxID=1577780 RepID=A0A6L3ZK15_9FLAO|nr:Rossmann-like and DUF2520 domain-containing protein [Phaeocystidibacter marisrubri]KAB2818177.1 DUF2520 domain-containing protein [Phaeocystidibacter marisrubri]GGH71549.1 hypothetical protein GCM10011318_14620 [Phaeocystidibacter marisrubri]